VSHNRNLLARLTDWFTAPSSSLTEIGDQQSARLAASFLIVTLVLDLAGAFDRVPRLGWPGAFSGGLGVSLFSTLLAYPLTRTKWYRVGIFIFSLSFAATAYFSILTEGAKADHGAIILIYVPLSLIIASSFLSPRTVFLLTGLNVGAYLALPFLGGTLPDNFKPQVGIIILIGLVLILLTSFHANLEKERLKDVQKINQELQTLSNQLEQENAELERFAYTVSHDLKSPLITIRGFLGFLRKDVHTSNSSRMESDIQRISEATDKMDRLLKELLELSRIGRIINPPEEISFRDLVTDSLELVQGRIMEREIEVHVEDQLPNIYGDHQRLVEVLQNLIDNAAKYMGDQSSPRIEIGNRNKANETIFFVRDNGIGIEPQYQTKIFGLFEKLDPSTEGTGIGLALVKRILEVHNGKIWVESEGLGKGSTFCFTVPDKKS
jgi:signal transduction histidine kinase